MALPEEVDEIDSFLKEREKKRQKGEIPSPQRRGFFGMLQKLLFGIPERVPEKIQKTPTYVSLEAHDAVRKQIEEIISQNAPPGKEEAGIRKETETKPLPPPLIPTIVSTPPFQKQASLPSKTPTTPSYTTPIVQPPAYQSMYQSINQSMNQPVSQPISPPESKQPFISQPANTISPEEKKFALESRDPFAPIETDFLKEKEKSVSEEPKEKEEELPPNTQKISFPPDDSTRRSTQPVIIEERKWVSIKKPIQPVTAIVVQPNQPKEEEVKEEETEERIKEEEILGGEKEEEEIKQMETAQRAESMPPWVARTAQPTISEIAGKANDASEEKKRAFFNSQKGPRPSNLWKETLPIESIEPLSSKEWEKLDLEGKKGEEEKEEEEKADTYSLRQRLDEQTKQINSLEVEEEKEKPLPDPRREEILRRLKAIQAKKATNPQN